MANSWCAKNAAKPPAADDYLARFPQHADLHRQQFGFHAAVVDRDDTITDLTAQAATSPGGMRGPAGPAAREFLQGLEEPRRRGCRACRKRPRSVRLAAISHTDQPARLVGPAGALRSARSARSGAASASCSAPSTRCSSAWSRSRCWPRRSPPPHPPANGFCARPGPRPRFGTRTSSRCTRSRSNRCRTW